MGRRVAETGAARRRTLRLTLGVAAVVLASAGGLAAWADHAARGQRTDAAAYRAVADAVKDARGAAQAVDACARATARESTAIRSECRRVLAALGHWRARTAERQAALLRIGVGPAAEFASFGDALEVLAAAVPQLSHADRERSADARLAFTTLAFSARSRAERLAVSVDRAVLVGGRSPGLGRSTRREP
jgi:hypothetical protein